MDAPAAAASPSLDAPLHARLLAWADRHRYWLLVIIPVLYLAAFNGQWRVSPDSALYASLGRNLAEGKGYTYQGERHTWVEPGFPYLISGGFRLAGPEQFWPTLLVLTLLSFVALWIFYRLMRLHAGRPTAVVLTAMLALNETFFRYPYHLFTDTPFLVGVLTFLLGYERLIQGKDEGGGRRDDAESFESRSSFILHLSSFFPWLLIALGTFVMVATRPAIWTFMGALVAATAWHILRGPNRLRHVVILAVACCSVLAYRAVDPRFRKDPAGAAPQVKTSVVESRLKDLVLHRTGLMIRRTMTEMVPLMFEEVAVEGIYGSRLAPGVNSLLTAATIGLGLLLMRDRPLWGLFIGATFAQMLIHLPRERYFLPILPLLLYALWQAAVWIELRLRGVAGRAAFVTVVVLTSGLNAAICVGDVIEQHRKPFLAYYEGGRYVPLIDLSRAMAGTVGEEDVVIAQEDRVVSYYSRRKTLPPITARRWAAAPAELSAFRAALEAAPQVFVLLPGEKVEALIEQWSIEVDPVPVLEAKGELTKHGKEVRYALHRVRIPAAAPATAALK
jgi:hypothetical protein